MRNVRPNVNWSSRPAAARLGAMLALAACAGAACARAERNVSRSSADSAVAAAPRSEPSRYLADIPPWPADTGAAATDREGRLPARLASAVPSCGTVTPVVAPDSVGPLYPGQPLANLFATCPHLSRLWHYDDGKYVPAIAVRLGAALLLLDASGVMSDAVVTRVTALEGARTAEGIGPGASLAEVARAYGAPTWRRDQCAVSVAFASRPGLVIHVAIPEGTRDSYSCEDIRRFATGNDFAHFPGGSTVAWIAAELDATG